MNDFWLMGERILPSKREIDGQREPKTDRDAMKKSIVGVPALSVAAAASLSAFAGCNRAPAPVAEPGAPTAMVVPTTTAVPTTTVVPIARAVPVAPAVSVLPLSKISLANYNLVRLGMTKNQVQTILGAPTSAETKDLVIFKKTTYRYEEGARFIEFTFKNDELDSKDSNLGTAE